MSSIPTFLPTIILPIVLIVTLIVLFILWRLKLPNIPQCPPCINKIPQETENLQLLVKYLSLVIKKNESEKELFRLSNGFHQVYNSPKLDLINKEIKSIKEEVRSDNSKLSFFKNNLDNII